jgi:hypothetical protein
MVLIYKKLIITSNYLGIGGMYVLNQTNTKIFTHQLSSIKHTYPVRSRYKPIRTVPEKINSIPRTTTNPYFSSRRMRKIPEAFPTCSSSQQVTDEHTTALLTKVKCPQIARPFQPQQKTQNTNPSQNHGHKVS